MKIFSEAIVKGHIQIHNERLYRLYTEEQILNSSIQEPLIINIKSNKIELYMTGSKYLALNNEDASKVIKILNKLFSKIENKKLYFNSIRLSKVHNPDTITLRFKDHIGNNKAMITINPIDINKIVYYKDGEMDINNIIDEEKIINIIAR